MSLKLPVRRGERKVLSLRLKLLKILLNSDKYSEIWADELSKKKSCNEQERRQGKVRLGDKAIS